MGKSHQRIVELHSEDLWTTKNIEWFLDRIQEETGEPHHTAMSLTDSPEQAYAEYVESVGGDVYLTMKWCTATTGKPARKSTAADTHMRQVDSPVYSTHSTTGWARSLCCFDDPKNGTKCQRPNCIFTHPSTILQEGRDSGYDYTDNDLEELFKCIPCCMAGMGQHGCWHHQRATDSWSTPAYVLMERENPTKADKNIPDITLAHAWVPSKTKEITLMHIGGKWTAQYTELASLMAVSVRQYLDGDIEEMLLPDFNEVVELHLVEK